MNVWPTNATGHLSFGMRWQPSAIGIALRVTGPWSSATQRLASWSA